ncbi:MAG: hypothetical protein ACLFVJ_14020 [Persicimonas sp.]
MPQPTSALSNGMLRKRNTSVGRTSNIVGLYGMARYIELELGDGVLSGGERIVSEEALLERRNPPGSCPCVRR